MWNDFTQQFWASTVDGLTIGSIYALIALGYTLVYGVLRLINFAHSEIFMIGTFAALGVLNLLGISGPADRARAGRHPAAHAGGRDGGVRRQRGAAGADRLPTAAQARRLADWPH